MSDACAPRTIADWTQLPLTTGSRSLIQASAGTGKTWTIAALYLRLVLEPQAANAAPLTPRQIVVTTFTKAAAQELCARLRARLAEAEQAAHRVAHSGGALPDDAAEEGVRAWLWRRWHDDPVSARNDRQRLRAALADFDLAPITTLHGLCQRILKEHPFESGRAFDVGEMVSTERLLDELSRDLWRCLQSAPDEHARYAPKTLAALRKTLALCLRPGVDLWLPEAADVERRLPASRAAQLEALAADKHIWKTKTSAPAALRALAAYLRDRQTIDTRALREAADLLAQHDDDTARDAARFIIDDALCLLGYLEHADEIRAWQAWTQRVRAWRGQRLSARGELTFDELIVRAHEALTAPCAQALAERLSAQWPVALVDEFQDTDALQYGILNRIHRDAGGTPRGALVLIGDPKQAIYRFRGGDIDTYLAAARTADAHLALDTNRRSSRAYVAALNELYARAGDALGSGDDQAIRYHAVNASGRVDDKPYRRADGQVAPALTLHIRRDIPAAAGERRTLALTACANQIAQRLQEGEYRIGDKPLEPGDIAVLLPNNGDVAQLRRLLRERRVPCAGSGRSSVLHTPWARELRVVLYAVEHADDAGAVCAALATRLGGMDFAALRAMRDDTEAWLPQLRRFEQARRTWQRDGVLAVVLGFADAAARQMADLAERERMLTDLRHLGELVQERSEQLHGAERLLAWLAAECTDAPEDAAESDERQLRIESDARRVRLMTLHASKGLEFPLVFLPLMWAHRSNTQDTQLVIHEPLCDRRVLGFGASAKTQYAHEGQDERFRVLYVALTRAIHACHVYVLMPDRLAQKGAKGPLGDPERAPLDVMVERIMRRAGKQDVPLAQWFEHAVWSEDEWPWPCIDYHAPSTRDEGAPQIREEPARAPVESLYSFSSLTRTPRGASREEAAADDEEAGAVERPDAQGADAGEHVPHAEIVALGVLRGTEFGNALHVVLEERVIGEPLQRQTDLIERALRAAGVRLGEAAPAAMCAKIAARLDMALATELAPKLRLDALPAQRQRAEMAFHYVLDAVSVARLRDACARHGEPDLVPSNIAMPTLRGFMTGKIDLVVEHEDRFHVLDYKSNHLGDALADYESAALRAVMDAHHYRFQALLYSVAVDRYLRQRISGYQTGAHLGEVFYLFLRAAGLAPGAGIWRHRFSDGLIAAVDRVLGADSPELAA
ncbi:MAG: UvrD-helicase domain-containing protein [Rhodanobacter sp.]|jgi:exodeoxyribonuclease V beta subunit|nr:UvrD-helicase domain-containing protein [Rhodanobacter sp.]